MRWLWLVLVVTTAHAGTMDAPELRDAAGDVDAGVLPAPANVDLLAAWVEGESRDVVRIHVLFDDGAVRSDDVDVHVTFTHDGDPIEVHATSLASAWWQGTMLMFQLPKTMRPGDALDITSVRVHGTGPLVWEARDEGVGSVSYIVGSQADRGVDTDGDRIDDRDELRNGTDPDDPLSPDPYPPRVDPLRNQPQPQVFRAGTDDLPLRPLGILVVEAQDLGCSNDHHDTWFRQAADLRVVVDAQGAAVAETVRIPDDPHPVWNEMFTVDVLTPADLTLRVQESEPGFQFEECDIDPGESLGHTFRLKGGSRLVQSGVQGGASGTIIVGDDYPTPPTMEVIAAPRHGQVQWTATRHGTAVDTIVVDGVRIGSGASGGSLALPGLCEGYAYEIRVERESGPWSFWTDLRFATPAGPPAPPTILSADRDGDGVLVRWATADDRGNVGYDVHGGPPGFAPGSATLLGNVSHRGGQGVAAVQAFLASPVDEVIVIAEDAQGYTWSERFTVGNTAVPPPPPEDCAADPGRPTFGAHVIGGDRKSWLQAPYFVAAGALLVAVVAIVVRR